jgi:uncharacterized protein YjbI with pentapeptide repeats
MSNRQAIALLEQGSQAWNDWRKHQQEARPVLEHGQFRDAWLNGLNLNGAKVGHTDFTRARLLNAKCVGASFEHLVFTGADLTGTDFRGAHLSHIDFSSSDLSWANLRGAHVAHSRFTAGMLLGADLRGAHVHHCNFDRANLIGAQLDGSRVEHCTFERALLGPSAGGSVALNNSLMTQVSVIPGNSLSGMKLARSDFAGVNLRGVRIVDADLQGADLRGADLSGADLRHSNLSGAMLSGAVLCGAKLDGADLSRAVLSGADLTQASLVKTRLNGAVLDGCRVFGISAWDVDFAGSQQRELIISEPGRPVITVDNIELAQFIYMLLNNQRIRFMIDTMSAKVVLILGRFTAQRKAVLDAIRVHLAQRNYLPVVFDFDKPSSRDITETVSTLAHLSRFVIADITEAKSIPQELMLIVPGLPSVPVLPLLQAGHSEYGMFEHFKRYPWVMDTLVYEGVGDLLTRLLEHMETGSAKPSG